MSVQVRIPTPLRPLVGGRAQVTTNGATVAEVIGALASEAPQLRAQLLSDDGKLRSFVNHYLNGEDVRSRSGLDTTIADGDELAIVPAIAGGAPA
jgi:molybdopterin converting factor small subunit